MPELLMDDNMLLSKVLSFSAWNRFNLKFSYPYWCWTNNSLCFKCRISTSITGCIYNTKLMATEAILFVHTQSLSHIQYIYTYIPGTFILSQVHIKSSLLQNINCFINLVKCLYIKPCEEFVQLFGLPWKPLCCHMGSPNLVLSS